MRIKEENLWSGRSLLDWTGLDQNLSLICVCFNQKHSSSAGKDQTSFLGAGITQKMMIGVDSLKSADTNISEKRYTANPSDVIETYNRKKVHFVCEQNINTHYVDF